ncbi:ankyrin repeat domain-containing protein [Clostridium estertheticum]|uniref:Ankyrin repeat domain-containing protein n=1 Tax=Clostridium estertheticum TaxID=238834 RepID=A0AA47I844_9CLOT|nr:ankyrin repeat domain-containing protein [Clostridium estertheticum]MBU3156731.1 ankyrin repeat domain-containing protein [Clostridium estertheticum]MBU3199092.1 ankyrin repeat domain-containing protein [Clostridium estertheticum]WAG62243.1 ankyrin repeat domain-containing protein [Clostridium estertheticum]WAG63644.1 ankyrin repeat domain-containing protein [Clostridium estertheticum]
MKIFEGLFAAKPKSVYRFIDDGNVDAIRDYLNNAKDLNPDLKLENILYYAIDNCQNNYFKTIELLINNGADINAHNSDLLETPLHKLCARIKPHIDVITMILKKGAKVNAINISGKTPVFYCSFNYSVELLNLLVEYGADINIRDKYKNTLLHDDYINCFDEHFEEFLKSLINLGFDINSTNSTGYTPLDLCENKKIADILIKYNGSK